eukprot:scaffold214009_cov23-Cyclotella_meneghiniana.AAC.1
MQPFDNITSDEVQMKEDLMRNDKLVDEPSINELQAVDTTPVNDGSSSIAATSNNSAINITSQQSQKNEYSVQDIAITQQHQNNFMQSTSTPNDGDNNNNFTTSIETQIDNYDQDHEPQHLPEGHAVPSSRIARAFGFASLGAGLAMGTLAELARRTVGGPTNNTGDNESSLILSNDANAQRLADSLRRMRGAAMKLGQMLSIQDESIAPPALTKALSQ